MLGAIEAGGTKFVCAVSDADLNIVDKVTILTKSPELTLQEVIEFFSKHAIQAIGIGSFGPIDVNDESDTFGYITNTPKEAWQNTDFVGTIRKHFDVPVGWTTDVNAAALGEFELGAARGTSSCIYITVGTGIGGGAIMNGKLLQGFGHPELGHMFIKKHPEDDFSGNCPFHQTCLEGLASGPAIEKRYGHKALNLADQKEVWELEAYYIAQAIVNLTLTLSPERIILGGGVMKQNQLYPLIRNQFASLLNGYVSTPDLAEYITAPELEDDAGIMGSLLLARQQL